MPTPDEQYQQLVKTTQADQGVVGFILSGGRGKGITTENSNYDIVIVVEDAVVGGARVKYQSYAGPKFDITVMSKRDLAIYCVWGSDTMVTRYNFAHLKAVIDRNGDTQRWLDEQELIPAPALNDAIRQSLDSYLNYVHRSLKNFRDLRNQAAHLAACDSVPQLITFLFTAEGRVRPYNEYIEWELNKHPLQNLKMDGSTFVKKISQLLADGNQDSQKEMLYLVRAIAGKSDTGKDVLKSWEEYYFG